jgi:hypothetical protein
LPNLPPSGLIQRSGQDIIKSSLRLVGSLRSGQNLSAAELADCLLVLQDFIDSCSAQRLVIYCTPYTTVDQNNNPLSLNAGQQKYVLGNSNGTEDFKMNRPPKIERVSVLYSASQSTPVEVPLVTLHDNVAWQSVANKSTPSLLPQICYIEPTADGTDYNLYFWPVPSQANPIAIYPWAALNQWTNLQQKYFWPPAYLRMIRYNLAVDLFAEFPGDMQKFPLVAKIANESMGIVKAINLADVATKEAVCNEGILGTHGMGNIYIGGVSRSLNN